MKNQMKNQKHLTSPKIFLMTLSLSFMVLTGCSKSDDDEDIDATCTNWSDQWLAQANAFSDASALYTSDPTLANCQNYKTAGLNYVEALESVLDCVPTVNSQEYINSLNEYRAEVNAIDCN
ncbi:MAG: hypothetical protein NWP87_01495 [Winogradskyella sp.]|nr:hypothetical protein [Winogradskyella sp.]